MLAFSKARTRNNVPIIPFTTRTPSLARERAASCRQRHVLVCTEEITAPHPAPCLPWHPHPYPNATTNLPLHNIHPFGPPDFLHHSTHAHTHTATQCHCGHTTKKKDWSWNEFGQLSESKATPLPLACLFVGTLCASLLIQPLWSVQPLIWTKIREFDPHFKEVGTQGLFSCPRKKKHILTRNQSDGAFAAGREVHCWVCQCVGRMCLQPTGKGDYYIDAAFTVQESSQTTSI